MLVNEMEVEAGFPDVPVELVVLTPLTTITGDGAVRHLVERVGDVELWLVDVHFLLAVVVKVVVAFNILLDVVVVVVLVEFVLLNLVVIVVDDLSQCTCRCRCSSRCCCSTLLCRCCCQRRCCGTIFVSEPKLLNSSSVATLFSMLSCLLFCLMLSKMLVLNSANSIILMSGLVFEDVVAEVLSISSCRTSCPDLRR